MNRPYPCPGQQRECHEAIIILRDPAHSISTWPFNHVDSSNFRPNTWQVIVAGLCPVNCSVSCVVALTVGLTRDDFLGGCVLGGS